MASSKKEEKLEAKATILSQSALDCKIWEEPEIFLQKQFSGLNFSLIYNLSQKMGFVKERHDIF